MKRFFLLLAVVGMLFTACVEGGANDGNCSTPTEPEYVTVSLGLKVGLDYGYQPLSRSEANNDLYGIQVYSAPVPATEDAEWTKYAYGLFDNTDNLTIKLVRGYEYKFVAAMVKDGKNKVSYSSYNDGYGAPFTHGVSTGGSEATPLSMLFIYSQLGLTDLGLGTYNFGNNLAVELYYGELESYIPGDNDSKATIELKRTSFGVKYIAKGDFAENGTLEILMTDAPQLNLNLAESNEVSEIYTFKNVRAAWLDENYTETISVTLRVAYSDGTSAPLGTHDITFKRNTTTVVNIDLTVGGDSGVGFVVTESGEMPEDSEVTIKDGEIVDTEIETK